MILMIKNIMQINIEYFHRKVKKACNSYSKENKKAKKYMKETGFQVEYQYFINE